MEKKQSPNQENNNGILLISEEELKKLRKNNNTLDIGSITIDENVNESNAVPVNLSIKDVKIQLFTRNPATNLVVTVGEISETLGNTKVEEILAMDITHEEKEKLMSEQLKKYIEIKEAETAREVEQSMQKIEEELESIEEYDLIFGFKVKMKVRDMILIRRCLNKATLCIVFMAILQLCGISDNPTIASKPVLYLLTTIGLILNITLIYDIFVLVMKFLEYVKHEENH